MNALIPPLRRSWTVAVATVVGVQLTTLPLVAGEPLPSGPDLRGEISRHCRAVLTEGIFHSESLACFPEMRQAVDEAMCSVDPGATWLPFAAGFGVGPEERGAALPPSFQPLVWRQPVDQVAWQAWRAEHCSPTDSQASIEADWGVGYEQPEAIRVAGRYYDILERTQEAFAAARAAAPRSLVEAWESCALSQRPLVDDEPGVACRLVSSAIEGGNEVLYFTASRILPPELTDPLLLPIPRPRLFAPKLRSDLEIEGAVCDGPQWRKGMRVKRVHTLRCRLQDASAVVTFRLTTSKGDCAATLTELRSPPWWEECRAEEPTTPPAWYPLPKTATR